MAKIYGDDEDFEVHQAVADQQKDSKSRAWARALRCRRL